MGSSEIPLHNAQEWETPEGFFAAYQLYCYEGEVAAREECPWLSAGTLLSGPLEPGIIMDVLHGMHPGSRDALVGRIMEGYRPDTEENPFAARIFAVVGSSHIKSLVDRVHGHHL